MSLQDWIAERREKSVAAGEELTKQIRERKAARRLIEEARKHYSDDELATLLKDDPRVGPFLTAGYSLPQVYEAVDPDAPRTTVGKMADVVASTYSGALNGASLGLRNKLIAGTAAAFGPEEDRWKNYRAMEESMRDTEHPTASLVGQIAGSMLPTTALATGTNALLRGTAATATRPEVSNTLRFLAGDAGQKMSGLPGWFLRRASQGVAGAAQGVMGAGATAALNEEPLAEQLKSGALWGAGLGTALPLAGETLAMLSGRIDPNVARMAEEANALGVRVRPGQVMQPASRADQIFAGKYNADQLPQFTRALSRTMGGDVDRLDEAALQAIRGNISQRFKDVAQNARLQLRQQDVVKVGDMLTEIAGRPAAADDKVLNETIKNILKQFQQAGGTLDGQKYLDMTQRGGIVQDLIESKDPIRKQYGIKLRGLLDDILEGGMPDQAANIRTARSHWKNMMTLVDTAEKAGEHGYLDPTKVKSAVLKAYSDYGFRGAGDLGTLAEAGQFLPRAMPSGEAVAKGGSGLPVALKGPAAGIAAGLTGAIAFQQAEPLLMAIKNNPMAAAGVVGTVGAGAAARPAIGSMMNSDWYRNLLLGVAQGRYPGMPTVAPWVGAENQLTGEQP